MFIVYDTSFTNNYIAHHVVMSRSIVNDRSMKMKETLKKKNRGSRTSIHRRLIPLPLLSPHLTARETQRKTDKNQQLP